MVCLKETLSTLKDMRRVQHLVTEKASLRGSQMVNQMAAEREKRRELVMALQMAFQMAAEREKRRELVMVLQMAFLSPQLLKLQLHLSIFQCYFQQKEWELDQQSVQRVLLFLLCLVHPALQQLMCSKEQQSLLLAHK